MTFQCSIEKPWGIHEPVRNDENCPRCGWTAPGPIGDAVADAIAAAEEAFALSVGRCWVVQDDHGESDEGQALAA